MVPSAMNDDRRGSLDFSGLEIEDENGGKFNSVVYPAPCKAPYSIVIVALTLVLVLVVSFTKPTPALLPSPIAVNDTLGDGTMRPPHLLYVQTDGSEFSVSHHHARISGWVPSQPDLVKTILNTSPDDWQHTTTVQLAWYGFCCNGGMQYQIEVPDHSEIDGFNQPINLPWRNVHNHSFVTVQATVRQQDMVYDDDDVQMSLRWEDDDKVLERVTLSKILIFFEDYGFHEEKPNVGFQTTTHDEMNYSFWIFSCLAPQSRQVTALVNECVALAESSLFLATSVEEYDDAVTPSV